MAEEVVKLERYSEDVWIIRLRETPKGGGNFENRFTPALISQFLTALDEVETNSKHQSCCLITTSSGKFFSNGLDIEWLMEQMGKENGATRPQVDYLDSYHRLLQRIMTFPMPTVAAINGHAIAGGWLLALAHDYRIMNSDNGFASMTEVDLGATLTPPLNTFLKEKLPRRVAAKMMTEGCRLTAQDMLKLEIIDFAVSRNYLLQKAIEQGRAIAPKASTGIYGELKKDLYLDAYKALGSGTVARSKL